MVGYYRSDSHTHTHTHTHLTMCSIPQKIQHKNPTHTEKTNEHANKYTHAKSHTHTHSLMHTHTHIYTHTHNFMHTFLGDQFPFILPLAHSSVLSIYLFSLSLSLPSYPSLFLLSSLSLSPPLSLPLLYLPPPFSFPPPLSPLLSLSLSLSPLSLSLSFSLPLYLSLSLSL